MAFSCKGRGVCPSCNGRHMAKTAAHLVDHVIPPVPVRQWVISVPKRKTAVAKSKELADTMAPTFEKAKSAFIKAYEEFTKDS